MIIASVLSPLFRTSIGAPVSDTPYCTDANLTTAQITQTEIPHRIADQLHYWVDIRGTRTWLQKESVALRKTAGQSFERTLDEVELAFTTVTFQLRLSFMRISFGDDFVGFLKFGEGTFAPLRTVRVAEQVCSAGQKPRFQAGVQKLQKRSLSLSLEPKFLSLALCIFSA